MSAAQPSRRIVITRRMRLDFRDGINVFIFALADAFNDAGADVTIVATTVGDRARLTDLYGVRALPRLVAIEEGPSRFSFEGLTPGWLLRGRRTIARHRPDLVLNNGALPFGVPGRSCNLAHDLGWARPRRLDRLRRAYKRYAYGQCDHVVALSREVGSGLARQLDTSPADILVIPPCVDLAAYPAVAPADREDAILHTGTEEYKDPAATIHSFAALDRPSARLYVEGDVDPGLRALVASLPTAVRDRVELLGALPAARLRPLLGSVRVASFPTRYAVPTASATVVEAVAAGTPVVGSPLLSGDVLRPGGTGLVAATDAERTAAFARLLGDDDGWLALSAGARAAAPRFSAAAVAARYLALPETPAS